MNRIVLHIDRLILHDMGDIDAIALASALENAIRTHLGDTDSAPRIAGLGNRAGFKTANLSLSAHHTSARLGAAIGRHVALGCVGKESS